VTADDFGARNIHFGIREHAMGSLMNGMALTGGVIPYGGTFLVFADYMRPPIRLASLAGLGAIYVFTHDSIFVGEDGPTHQPIEHLASLRCIPGLLVYRPADALETAAAWTTALNRRDAPTALVLTRQKLETITRPAGFKPADALNGAYTVVEETGDKKALVIASGSELAPAAAAAKKLGMRCVSMPSVELFLERPEQDRQALIPKGWRVAAVEASRDPGWYRFCGTDGLIIGIDRFGASAPAQVVAENLGITPVQIEQKLSAWLG
jgi:transketolase